MNNDRDKQETGVSTPAYPRIFHFLYARLLFDCAHAPRKILHYFDQVLRNM